MYYNIIYYHLIEAECLGLQMFVHISQMLGEFLFHL